MEYRNNNFTPRDRLDERFIRELLDLEFDNGPDNERSCTGELRNNRSDNRDQTVNRASDNGYTSHTGRQRDTREQREYSDSYDKRESRSERRDSDNDSSGCGCGRSRGREARDYKEDNNNRSRRDNRSGRRSSDNDSSGCGCGCGRGNTRDTHERNDDRSSCAARADRSERDYNSERSCGCGCSANSTREARSETDTGGGANDGYPSDGYCGCGDCEDYSAPMLRGVPLAMVYSPHQEWGNLYEPEVGHSRGTIFKCLDFPFYPTGCNKNTSSCGCSDNNRKR